MTCYLINVRFIKTKYNLFLNLYDRFEPHPLMRESLKILLVLSALLCNISVHAQGVDNELDSLKQVLSESENTKQKERAILRLCRLTGLDSKPQKKYYFVYKEASKHYTNKAQYDSAILYYNKLLSLNLGRDTVIQTLGNSGTVFQKMGDYAHALDNFQKAYSMLYEDMSSETAATYEDSLTLMGLKYEIANIYKSVPDYERALESYKEVKELNKYVQYSWFDVWAYMGIGDCYLEQQKYEEAISAYKLAEQPMLEDPTLLQGTQIEYLSQVQDRTADAYFQFKQIDSAYKYAYSSLQIAEGRNSGVRLPRQLPTTYTTIGKVYRAQGKYNIAIKYLKLAADLSHKAGAEDVESNAWLELSNTYKKIHNEAAALVAYKNHITLRDSIYSRANIQKLTRVDMQGYFDRQRFTDSIERAKEKEISSFELQRQRTLTYSGLGGVLLLLLLSFIIFRNYKREKKAKMIISEARDAINEEKQVSERLLLNILPEEVASELKEKGNVEAQQFDDVTVLFTDFLGFTLVGEQLTPKELVAELHTCFKAFDEIIDKYDIEKIKTVGDAYLAVSGLPQPNPNHAADVINAALDIAAFLEHRKKEKGDLAFMARIGVNSGSVVAGIVGVKKFAYDIWGDTVNIAARMEQNGVPGKVNISEYTYELVKDKFNCIYRGELEAKNKGKMKMYFAER